MQTQPRLQPAVATPTRGQDPHRSDRTPDALLLRGRWAGPACLVVRRGPRARLAGLAFEATHREDLQRLAGGTGASVVPHRGGHAVNLHDPSGFSVQVVSGAEGLPALPERAPLPLNFGPLAVRTNATQRPPRRVARSWPSSAATRAVFPPITTPLPWPCSHRRATCTRPTN